MKNYTQGCFICGKPLVYDETEKPLFCHICGAEHMTNVACEKGHYICNSCHSEQGITFIVQYLTDTKSKNPILIADEIMGNAHINMHGPEHHYLVVASLLTAYKNSGGDIELEKALHRSMQRAKNIPGGVCGMWGSCGAAIATGIFICIITGATPLSEREWSQANQMTSKSLALIAEHGGPRCCKRNTYLAITQAVDFVKEQLGIVMEMPENVACRFSHRNEQCRNKKCLYFDVS